MRAGTALAGLVLLPALAVGARAGVPAVEISTDLSPSVARDVDEWGRIYVEGPDAWDGRPSGQIRLPPHPGGGEFSLPCSDLDPEVCFHTDHVVGGFAESGRIIGRQIEYGSGGPFIPAPATWSADGTLTTLLKSLDESISDLGHVAHGSSGDVFVGFLWKDFFGAMSDLVPVY
jgi:hypothetical protein